MRKSNGFLYFFSKKFGSRTLIIENIKTEDFYKKLSSVFSVERFNKITLNLSGDDEIFLNIKVTL